MKKVLISVIALGALAGCSGYYDYYKGGVRYTQDGEDCIYYAAERGRKIPGDFRTMDSNDKIVYRNTRCSDLYARDNLIAEPRVEHQIVAPAPRPTCGGACPVCDACAAKKPTCGKCGGEAVLKRRYIITPAI